MSASPEPARWASRGAACLAGLAVACGGQADAPPTEPESANTPRPNVVLISIDSLRADHLGCYGYPKPTSPTLDRLAGEGVRFESAIASTSWTLPSHASMFTGLHDSSHGLMTPEFSLAEVHHTLAETLRGTGYRTAGFYGGPFLHPTFGLHQGFDTWQSCMTGLGDDESEAEFRSAAIGDADRANSAANVTGPRTLAEVRRWLDTGVLEQDAAPFFLFVHLWDVHYDYVPPAELVALFDPDYTGSIDGTNFESDPAINANLPARDIEHLLALYDGEIRFTDGIIAELLESLFECVPPERTLLIVTADHGDEFFEHGGKGHQHELYDELIKVPLIFRWPGELPGGLTVTDQVSLIDLKPTILSLVGATEGWPSDGRDLTPLLRGGQLPSVPALSELGGAGDSNSQRSLRTPALKAYSRSGSGGWGFDLAADPGETVRLPGKDERVQPLVKELRQRVRDARERNALIGADAASADMTAEMEAKLRALGYLEASGAGSEDR